MIVYARPAPSWWTLLPLALGGLAGLLLAADCGNIQEAYADDETPALALARVCSGETSWDRLDECAAIGEVLARRSETGTVTPSIARRYSSALRTARRPWVAQLDPSGARPAGWPQTLSWAAWRPRWAALLEHAGRIVAGDAPSACSEPPDHFGGPMDHWRAQAAGWRVVDCGRTLNRFYAVGRGRGR